MRRILIGIILYVLAVCGLAAVTQTGYVKTRGRLGSNGQVIPGKRLGAATVVLQNGSSVVSNQSGNFSLALPGNKFYLKDVKKTGYVVSDPDILSKQYTYSTNPLVLVLDEPTTQQDDKLASERRLRRNLQKQLQQREDELEALKEENKITQEQYREALQKLYDDQESNDKFISEMAERYSRLDFDQLDDFQRKIAEFIQNGELVKADSLLRTKGSMTERGAEIKRLQKANTEEEKELADRERRLGESKKTAETLLADYAADCYSRFEICKLKFENDSAAYWLEKRAQLFPDNVAYQLEAGEFIREYMAKYSLALDYYNKALALALDKHDVNDRDVALCYINIGLVYYSQGDYTRALENYEKALKKQLNLFYNNPDVAFSYNNIGLVYYSLGDYTQALENHKKALQIWLDIFGESNYFVATSYNNIGLVYYSQGDYTQALENFEKALKIKMDDGNCSEVATIYSNIGLAYFMGEDYIKALEKFEEVLRIWSVIFDDNHPNVAGCYNNIGTVYSTQREYTKALVNYEKALKIRLVVFGVNHPDVAMNYHNIGYVYYNQGDYAQALENFEKALKIRLVVSVENHPDVAMNYHNIGYLYDSQGDYAQALENFEKALKIWLEINHPKVEECYNDIGLVYYSQRNYARALENFEEVLKIRVGIYGESDPNVKEVKDNIDYLRGKMEGKE